MFHGAEPRFVDPRLISFLATNSEMVKLFNQNVKLLFYIYKPYKKHFMKHCKIYQKEMKRFPAKQLNPQIMVFNKNNAPIPVRLTRLV